MATKPKQEVKKEVKQEVKKETTFDERTAQGKPWLNKDGSQNNGQVVESKPVVEGEDS